MIDETTAIDDSVLEQAAKDFTTAEAKKQEAKQITFLTDDELWGADPPDQSSIVASLGISYGPPTILVGQSYTGKTLISMSLGIAIAGARLIWSRHLARSGVYVHLDYEQGLSETKRRIQRLALGMGLTRADLESKIKVSIFPAVNLTTPKAVEEFTRIMTGARVLVVDSLKAVTPGTEENSSNLRDLIRVLTAASEKSKCAVIIIHHAGKGDEEDPRGSSAIRDEASTIYSVTGSARSTKTIRNSKNRPRSELTPDFGLSFREPDIERVLEPIPDDHYMADGGFRLSDVPPVPPPLIIEVTSLDGAYEERILTWLREHDGAYHGTRTQFVAELGGRRAESFSALTALVSASRITIATRPAQIALAPDVPAEQVNVSSDDFINSGV